MSRLEYIIPPVIAAAALTIGFSVASHPFSSEAAYEQATSHPIQNFHEAVDTIPYAAKHFKDVLKAAGFIITHADDLFN